MHEAVFEAGAVRVGTVIKIDDRRDRTVSMEDKLRAVEGLARPDCRLEPGTGGLHGREFVDSRGKSDTVSRHRSSLHVHQAKKTIDSKVLRTSLSPEKASGSSAQEILTWAIKNFHPRIALSCSFGAPEGLVLLDMMHRIEPGARVFVLDTGRLPQATHDLIDRVRERYDKQVEVLLPRGEDVEAMVRAKGMNLFYESIENRQLCCRMRKVEPLKRYLAGARRLGRGPAPRPERDAREYPQARARLHPRRRS